jgi:hypothetical protein
VLRKLTIKAHRAERGTRKRREWVKRTSRATAEAGGEAPSVPPGRAAEGGGARTGEPRGVEEEEEEGDWGRV